MPEYHSSDARIYYKVEDAEPEHTMDGVTFALIHGWGCNSSDWDPVLPLLAIHGRVVTLDLRGCGRSAVESGDFTLPATAGDVSGVLHSIGASRVVAVGHSAGAEVVATCVAAEPQLFRAWVAVDPAYGVPADNRDSVREVLARLEANDPCAVASNYFAQIEGSKTPPELKARHRRAPMQENPQALLGIFREFAFGPGSLHFRPVTDRVLAGITPPALAIYRNSARAAVGRELIDRTNTVVRTYAGAGHWMHQERPAQFVSDVTTWLRSLEETPS